MKTNRIKTDRHHRRFLLTAIMYGLTVWGAHPATADCDRQFPTDEEEERQTSVPHGNYILSRSIPEGILKNYMLIGCNQYKTYGKHYTLDIFQYIKSYMTCSVIIGPWQTKGTGKIKEANRTYNYDLQGDRLTVTYNDTTSKDRPHNSLVMEIWDQTILPQTVTNSLEIISDGRTSKDDFDGVWIYKGQYLGQAQEQCPTLIIPEHYGPNLYKVYCGSHYCTLWIRDADDEKGTYTLLGLHPDSFERLSKEYAIERGIYELSFKWEDENNYYLTYFSPNDQVYFTEKWTRTTLPAKIIQTLRECGF